MTSYFPARPGDPDRARVRAGNADRNRADAFLAAAMSAGVITPEEYTERAGTALSAANLGELDALCADLPVERLGGELAQLDTGRTQISSSGAAPVTKATSILSSHELRGGAVVGDHLSVRTVMGSVEVDLRDVEFTAPVLTVSCRAVLGNIRVLIPSDVTCEVHGSGVAGSFISSAAGSGRPGAPRIIVKGRAVLGSVAAERVARGQYTGPRRAR
ncbi:DUF1707 SHOCT-like domain-containing protein [Gordonia sp. (in: high G+C Gram-positive bacteria)]|uniref:DUF1707 SHOCT-like domain-containing protein n=1 Tax=Gordonia sp. (in: high G+C Gram-positive bacteria) TaxID=84139 RepID=UPI0039E635E0